MTEGVANMVILAPTDNVGIALRDIAAGSLAHTIGGAPVEAVEAIPQGHKIALLDIAQGNLIHRLDVPIGIAKTAIGKGTLVHVHNVASRYLNNDEDHYE
jgi:hypothetical protein